MSKKKAAAQLEQQKRETFLAVSVVASALVLVSMLVLLGS